MKYDTTDKIMFTVGFLVASLLLTVLSGAIIDITQSFRAEPKEFACRVQQMDHVRRSFTANVTCVPYLTRQDTLTIRK